MNAFRIYKIFLATAWVGSVSLFLVLFFDGGHPGTLVSYVIAQIGPSVEMSASVPPNPYNTLAQQLQDKEDELKLREQALNQHAPAGGAAAPKADLSLDLLATLGFLLSIYLPLHFFRDWREQEKNTTPQPSV